HQHAWRAIAALQGVPIAKSLLQVADFATVGQPFDGLHRRALHLYRQHKAGAHDLAVDPYGAGATDPVLTTDMCTGQLQLLAQEIPKIEPRQHMRIDALTIDLQRNRDRRSHGVAPASSGRCKNAAIARMRSTLARCWRIAREACWSS